MSVKKSNDPTDHLRQIQERLADPFHPAELRWKPQATAGNKALAICYVDARAVMDRLDAVFGIAGWQDDYTVLDSGAVQCRLSVCLNGVWVTRCDVGGESEQKDEHDRAKAAHSDALKRSAVKFGVARYIYRLGGTWVGYDPQRKRLLQTPSLPEWALPKGGPALPLSPPVEEPEDLEPPADRLSNEQATQLAMLIAEAGVSDETFCAWAATVGEPITNPLHLHPGLLMAARKKLQLTISTRIAAATGNGSKKARAT